MHSDFPFIFCRHAKFGSVPNGSNLRRSECVVTTKSDRRCEGRGETTTRQPARQHPSTLPACNIIRMWSAVTELTVTHPDTTIIAFRSAQSRLPSGSDSVNIYTPFRGRITTKHTELESGRENSSSRSSVRIVLVEWLHASSARAYVHRYLQQNAVAHGRRFRLLHPSAQHIWMLRSGNATYAIWSPTSLGGNFVTA